MGGTGNSILQICQAQKISTASCHWFIESKIIKVKATVMMITKDWLGKDNKERTGQGFKATSRLEE